MRDSQLPAIDPATIDPAWRIAIVRSQWHAQCTDQMFHDAVKTLKGLGIKREQILEIIAPGSFEIPLIAKSLIDGKKADAVIAFGVIVQGQTHHAGLIAQESARALMDLQMQSGVPVIFEILYVDDIADAVARSSGPEGKGTLAAQTALKALAVLKDLR